MGGELLKTTVSSNPGILQKKTHHNIDSIRVVTCHVIFFLKKKISWCFQLIWFLSMIKCLTVRENTGKSNNWPMNPWRKEKLAKAIGSRRILKM